MQHVVICGFGRLGSCVARCLRDAGLNAANIVVLEKERCRAEEARRLGFRVIARDATDQRSLQIAQVGMAREAIVCLNDQDSLTAIRLIHSVAPRALIRVALQDDEKSAAATAAGAQEVLSLSWVAGTLLAESVEEQAGKIQRG